MLSNILTTSQGISSNLFIIKASAADDIHEFSGGKYWNANNALFFKSSDNASTPWYQW
ncbi:hypothetical protein [Endozoicomonas sp.]|uniref:hypothetical protein n=1 Tax=Endozoicomonas sp. TaxID=1892382 RepID=UPI00383BE2A6